MPTIKEAASEFLAHKRIAVTGVSRKPKEHGSNTVFKRLRDRGYQVFAVNPLAVARYRDRHQVSGVKSDAGDAKLLADLVRTDRHNHRPIAGDSPTGAGDLRLWDASTGTERVVAAHLPAVGWFARFDSSTTQLAFDGSEPFVPGDESVAPGSGDHADVFVLPISPA